MRPETEKIAEMIKETLDAKKGLDIVSMDISEMTIMTECFVVASGATALHTRALADAVYEKRKEEENVVPLRQEGYDEGIWIVLDYGDVMVHLFRDEERRHYNLERLWLQEHNFSFHSNDAVQDPAE